MTVLYKNTGGDTAWSIYRGCKEPDGSEHVFLYYVFCAV